MATFYGPWVATDDFRAILEATVSNTSATQCTVKLVVKIQSNYAHASSSGRASATCNGTTRSASVAYSAGKTTTLMTESFTVARGSSSKSISVSGKVWQLNASSAYAKGSTASGKVTIPAIDYDAPNAPSSCAASRVSDTSAKVTWKNGGTTTLKPRSSVKVERQTDGGSWSQIASVGASTANYTDNSISANHRYAYRVRSYGAGGYSGYSTSGYIYTTPAAPSSVSITKTSGTQVSLSVGTSSSTYATAWEVQESLNGGGWAAVGSFATFPQTVDVGGGTAKLRVRAVRGTLASAWVESDTVTTIVAPLAPTITNKPASVVPVGGMLFIQWKPNHPDGTEQTEAQVGWTFGDSPEEVYTVYGDDTTSTYLSTEPCAVKVRVRTKGLAEGWGAWSSYYSFTVAVPPEAHFTAPGIDGVKIGDLPLTVAWEVVDDTGVAAQTLQLTDEAGRVLHTAAPSTSAREYELGASTYQLSNATAYRLVLTVRGGSSLTVTTTRDFATSFAEPSRPSANVELDESAMSQAVTVHAGPSTSDTGEVIEVSATPGTLVPGFEVYGRTRQNLWVNPSGTSNGVTVTSNDDGSITVSGDSSGGNVFIDSARVYALKQDAAYRFTCDKMFSDNTNAAIQIVQYDSNYQQIDYSGLFSSTTDIIVITKPDMAYVKFRITIYDGRTYNQDTYRVMLRDATKDEIAAAQQTASTLQEGGTADLPQDYPVTLPADPSVYADAEAFGWCPPGINGVEPSAIVTAGKNLLDSQLYRSNYSYGYPQVSSDKSSTTKATLPFTNTAAYVGIGTYFYAIGGETYTFTQKNAPERAVIKINQFWPDQAGVSGTSNGTTGCFGKTKVDNGESVKFERSGLVFVLSAMPDSSTDNTWPEDFGMQVELGSTATEYEPPAVTSTPIDMQGHSLYSLPDGTRDVLQIDGTGKATLVQNVGIAKFDGSENWKYDSYKIGVTGAPGCRDTVTTNGFCDTLPPEGLSDSSCAINAYANGWVDIRNRIEITDAQTGKDWLAANQTTYLYPLASPRTVDLGTVTMPEFPADPTTVWAVSDIPGEVSVAYPDTDSLSVTRVLADGSRWLVADGLADGEQAIDPLPPLNVPYSYEITASTGAGATSEVRVTETLRALVGAFNFGLAAGTCELAELDPDWSHDVARSGTLYHFADGGEGGGLPVAYGGQDVDATRSMGFTLLDLDQLRRMQDLARRYFTCWYRDPYGGRALCSVSWSFSSGIPYGKLGVSASMTETVFEEAW